MTTPTISQYEAAVSAALKLHAPEEFDALYCSSESECTDCHPESGGPGSGHTMMVCTECVGVTDDDNPGRVPYPCRTVRALSEALGEGRATATELSDSDSFDAWEPPAQSGSAG